MKSLAGALAAADPTWRAVVDDPDVEIVPLHVPFAATVVEVLRRSRFRVSRDVVGWVDGGTVRVLTGDPAAFAALVADSGAVISDVPAAVALVVAAITLTSDGSVRILEDPGDLAVWASPSAEDVARIDAARDRQASVLVPPRGAASVSGDRFVVELVALAGRSLVRSRAEVTRTGVITAATETLEQGLPVTTVA